MSLQNYSRGERYTQIMMTLLMRAKRGQGDEMTMYQVARALGMKPSTHVSKILAEMCARGKLTCRKGKQSGRWDTYFFKLHERYSDAGAKAEPRHINVRANGRQVGQLELF